MEQFTEVAALLEYAKSYGLLDEIVFAALRAMQENPDLTPSQAIESAIHEWIK